MRILHQDTRTNEIKVQVDSLDDLWHLFNLVERGDLVFAVTYRREEGKADKLRAERGEKKRMRLGIRVERVEFHEFEDRLRILGTIEEGPQDLGSHHTINVQEGEVLSIIKGEWMHSHLQRLRRAVEETRKPRMVLVALEYEEAVVAVLRQYGVQEVAHILSPSSGKMFDRAEGGDYYGEIADKVAQLAEEGTPLIVLGPGFAKETLLLKGRERYPELFGRAHLFHTGQAGMAGIHELMKRGLGAEVLEDSRVAMEVMLVEKVLEGIAKDGPVAYGPKEVEGAARMGAVETLLVLDEMVRSRGLDPLMKLVEETGGKVVVVSEHHDAGRELEALGGLAALLRFRVV